uniref:Uncharacterized protein n=1 Tax=viral metagenome TaxID=1070528 RepID=A0A6C0JRI2_9ZZZZ
MLFLSLNVGILAIFYTVLGGLLSYGMHHLFDEFDDGWKSKSIPYQLFDVSIELVLIGLIAFWTIFFIKDAPPVFPVSKEMDSFVDSYVSGIFFSFSLFLFFGDLESKIKYLYEKAVDPVVKKNFPTKGSILDGSLTFESRKTDKIKITY